jgi:hypothetical protein
MTYLQSREAKLVVKEDEGKLCPRIPEVCRFVLLKEIGLVTDFFRCASSQSIGLASGGIA